MTQSKDCLRFEYGHIEDATVGVLSLKDVAVFLAFVSVTVAFATTTSSSRVLIEWIRFFSVLTLVLIIVFSIFRDYRFHRSSLLAIGAYFLYSSYAVVGAVANGGAVFVEESLARDVLLTVALIYVFFKESDRVIPERVAQLLLVFGFLMVGLTIYFDGISFSYPPRFNFEYGSILLERSTSYSQGASKFYGLFAIVAAYLGAKSIALRFVFVYSLCVVFFLFLSILGGARGDSVAAVLLVLGYLFFAGRAIVKAVLLSIVFILVAVIATRVELTDFALFSRLQSLDGGLGAREDLYGRAIDLVASEWRCSYFGCGFAYFQKYYGLSAAHYPHNFFLELGIVYGIPLGLLLLILAVYGAVLDSYETGGANALFYIISMYFFLIQLKSGTLLSGWWLMASVFFFAGKALQSLEAGFRR